MPPTSSSGSSKTYELRLGMYFGSGTFRCFSESLRQVTAKAAPATAAPTAVMINLLFSDDGMVFVVRFYLVASKSKKQRQAMHSAGRWVGGALLCRREMDKKRI